MSRLIVSNQIAGYARKTLLKFIIFVLFAAWWIIGSAHLLENLQAGPHLALFMALGISRMMVVLLSLFAVLVW